MGNAHVLRGRMAPALILVAMLALAVIVTLGLTAAPASATSSFTLCSSCHNYAPGDAFHTKTPHGNQTCTKCHVNGVNAAGVVSSACASCHGTPAQIVAAQPTNHTSCSSAACHGSTPTPTPTATATTTPTPTPTATATPVATTMTLKASPTIQRLGRSVKFSGRAGSLPALAGAKVAFKVERKVGTKWVKMKTTAKTVNATTGAFAWTYKTVKKGAHRVTASIAAKAGVYKGKKLVRSFRVR